MAPLSRRIAFLCAIALAVFAAIAAAQQQVYRYVDKDGRVIYSDRAPPPDSKEIQAKRLSPNFIENNDVPIATQQAAQRFPVTLYTFACGEVCQNAEALLNRRGVPYTTVNVEDQKGAEQLMKLTGAQQAPVLQVGDKLIAKGFNESRWTTMLDDAGYPKSPPRRTAAKVAESTPAPAAPAAPAALPAAPDGAQSVAVPGSGYPKQ
jgi:glutaredoxin